MLVNCYTVICLQRLLLSVSLYLFDLTMIIPRRDIFRSSAARYMYNFFFLVCFAAVRYFRRILKRGERWKLFMQRREVVEEHLLERRNP